MLNTYYSNTNIKYFSSKSMDAPLNQSRRFLAWQLVITAPQPGLCVCVCVFACCLASLSQ